MVGSNEGQTRLFRRAYAMVLFRQPSVVVLVGMDFLRVLENHQALICTQCLYVVTNHSLAPHFHTAHGHEVKLACRPARILDAPRRIDGKPTTVGEGQISRQRL